MNAKLHIHPAAAERNNSSESDEPVEPLLECIRAIQTDAKQICADAADIEDARFIAEGIIDVCRRALASRSDYTSGRTFPLQRPSARAAAPIPQQRPDRAKKAAARARLDVLSARELEIFTHLAEGRSAAEIAVVLSRSSKTINNHRTRILQKLGLRNATELVRLAVHSGLVSV